MMLCFSAFYMAGKCERPKFSVLRNAYELCEHGQVAQLLKGLISLSVKWKMILEPQECFM